MLTICDTSFEKIPLYYDIKLLLALLLFVDPPKFINKIKEIINGCEVSYATVLLVESGLNILRPRKKVEYLTKMKWIPYENRSITLHVQKNRE